MHSCSQGPLRPFWSQLCLIRLALSLLVTTSRKTFTSKGTKLEAGHKYFDSQGFSTERRTPSLEIFYFIKKICIYVYTCMMLMQFTTILVHQNWSHMLVSFALKITLRFEGKYLYHILYFCLFFFFFRSFYDNVKENNVSFIYKFASIQTLCCGLGGSL